MRSNCVFDSVGRGGDLTEREHRGKYLDEETFHGSANPFATALRHVAPAIVEPNLISRECGHKQTALSIDVPLQIRRAAILQHHNLVTNKKLTAPQSGIRAGYERIQFA